MTTRRAHIVVVAAALLTGGCDRSTPLRPCDDACAGGATQCDAAGSLRRCLEPATVGGCRTWSAAEPCGGPRVCRGGLCVCPSPCQSGDSVCASATAEQRCVGPDADGCFAWGEPTSCADGVACEGGSCGCARPCQPGATACGPGGERLTCTASATCPSWTAAACPERQACVTGECGCANPCVANQVQCDAIVPALLTCAAPDENGCTAWDPPAYCDQGLVCKEGVGPGHVPSCVTYTPPGCADVNECDFVGQKLCQSDTQYRECSIRAEDGCLRLDCFT